MDNITVTYVSWSGNSLRDSTVTDRLRRLTSFVGKLYVAWNSLTEIPALTQYWHMETLQELSLEKNEIQTLVWENIPTHVQYLDLQSNKLESLPPIGAAHRCLQVRHLMLRLNKIRTLDANMIPASLEELNMYSNLLIELGDISQLTPKVLHLEFNQLTEVKGEYLPASLEKLYIHFNPLSQTVDLRHLLNLTDLYVSRNDCQGYKQMLPNVRVYKNYWDQCP